MGHFAHLPVQPARASRRQSDTPSGPAASTRQRRDSGAAGLPAQPGHERGQPPPAAARCARNCARPMRQHLGAGWRLSIPSGVLRRIWNVYCAGRHGLRRKPSVRKGAATHSACHQAPLRCMLGDHGGLRAGRKPALRGLCLRSGCRFPTARWWLSCDGDDVVHACPGWRSCTQHGDAVQHGQVADLAFAHQLHGRARAGAWA